MASLWGSFGVESIAEQIGGAVSKASELAKDVIADGIEEDEVEVATRTLQSTAVERDDALQAAESAELQIATISQQYRQLLIEREADISRLKEELHAARAQLATGGSVADVQRATEGTGQTLLPTALVGSLAIAHMLPQVRSGRSGRTPESAERRMTQLHVAGPALEGGAGDEDDLGHVLSVQQKLNTVSRELERTKTELEGLKQERAGEAQNGPADLQQVQAELSQVRSELRQTIDQHQGQLSDMQAMHEHKHAEANATEKALHDQLAAAEKRIEELDAELDRERLLHLNVDTHTEQSASPAESSGEVTALRQELELAKTSTSALEKKCQVHLKKIAALTAEKKSQRTKIADLESAAAMSSSHDMSSDLQAAEADRDRATSQLEVVQSQHKAALDAVATERATLEARIASLEAENATLSEAAEGDQRAVTEAVGVLKAQVAIHEKTIQSRTADLDSARQELNQMQIAVANSTNAATEAAALKEELAGLGTTTLSYQKEMAEAVARCSTLEQTLQEKEAALAAAELSASQAKELSHREIQTLQERCQQLESNVHASLAGTASASDTAAQLQSRVTDLEAALNGSQVEVVSAKQKIVELEATTVNSSAESSRLQSQVAELEATLASSQAEVTSARQQIAELQVTTTTLADGFKEDNERLEARALAAEQAVAISNETAARLNTEKSQLEQHVLALQSELQTVTSQCTALKAELDTVEATRDSEHASASSLAQSQAQLEAMTLREQTALARVGQLETEISALRQSVDAGHELATKLAGTQQELAAVTAQLESVRASQEFAAKSEREALEALQTKLSDSAAALEASKARETEINANMLSLQRREKELELQLQQTNQQWAADRESSEVRVATLNTQIQGLQAEKGSQDATSTALDQSQARVTDLEAQVREAQASIASGQQARIHLQEAQQRISELETQFHETTSTVSSLQTALDTAKSTTRDMETEADIRSAEMTALQERLAALEAQLVDQSQNDATVQGMVDQLHAENARLKTEKEAAEVAQSEAEQAVDTLKSRVTEVSALAVSKDAEIARLEAEVKSAQQNIEGDPEQFGVAPGVPNGGARVTSAAAAFLTGGPASIATPEVQVPSGTSPSASAPTNSAIADDAGTVVSLRIERDRLRAQLEKLQNHLMQVSDQHTEEILQHEEQVSTHQANAEVAQAQVEQVTRESAAAIKALEARVKSLEATAARALQDHDRVQKELVAAQAEITRLTTGLENLEVVLQDFESGKAAAISAATAVVQSECDRISQELKQAMVDLDAAAAERESHRQQSEAFAAVQQDAHMAAGLCKSLQRDVERLQNELQNSQAKLAAALTASPAVVDKLLIKNFIIQYVEHTGEQQKEVMALMANMLDFDEAERYSVGLGQRRGFITQLFAGPAVKPQTPGKAAAPTFASDLVEFMMTEAQAAKPPATPAPVSTPYPATNTQPQMRIQQRGRPSDDHSATVDTLTPLKLGSFTPAQTP